MKAFKEFTAALKTAAAVSPREVNCECLNYLGLNDDIFERIQYAIAHSNEIPVAARSLVEERINDAIEDYNETTLMGNLDKNGDYIGEAPLLEEFYY